MLGRRSLVPVSFNHDACPVDEQDGRDDAADREHVIDLMLHHREAESRRDERGDRE